MNKNKQITIRPQLIKDAKDFYSILTGGNFEFFPANVPSIEAEKRFLRKSVADFKSGKNLNFSILLEGRVIGAVGVMPEASRPYNAEVGYFIDRKQHGKGFTVQALKLAQQHVIDYCPAIHRLHAIIVPKNKASIRVIEKSGYSFEGIMKQYLKLAGKRHDAAIYAKIIR